MLHTLFRCIQLFFYGKIISSITTKISIAYSLKTSIMKTTILTKSGAIIVLALLFTTCRKDETNLADSALLTIGDGVSDSKKPSTDITGVGYYAEDDEC